MTRAKRTLVPAIAVLAAITCSIATAPQAARPRVTARTRSSWADSETAHRRSSRGGVEPASRLLRATEQRQRPRGRERAEPPDPRPAAGLPVPARRGVAYSEGDRRSADFCVSETGPLSTTSTPCSSPIPSGRAGPGARRPRRPVLRAVMGAPLYGSDRNFGDIPTVSICTNDVICDSAAPSGWIGYLTGAAWQLTASTWTTTRTTAAGSGSTVCSCLGSSGSCREQVRRHPTRIPVSAGPPAAARRSNETSEPTSHPSKAST